MRNHFLHPLKITDQSQQVQIHLLIKDTIILSTVTFNKAIKTILTIGSSPSECLKTRNKGS